MSILAEYKISAAQQCIVHSPYIFTAGRPINHTHTPCVWSHAAGSRAEWGLALSWSFSSLWNQMKQLKCGPQNTSPLSFCPSKMSSCSDNSAQSWNIDSSLCNTVSDYNSGCSGVTWKCFLRCSWAHVALLIVVTCQYFSAVWGLKGHASTVVSALGLYLLTFS